MRMVLFRSWLALAAGLGAALAAAADARVELTVVGEAQASGEFHQWAQALGRAGIENVRFRSAESTDRPAIERVGSPERPSYRVTAVLGPRGEVAVPGGRFTRGEVARLAAWLDELKTQGPPADREPTTAFGLTARQLDAVRADLTPLVGFATQDLPRREAVRRIVAALRLPCRLDAEAAALLTDNVAENLATLSRGTALACLLRPAGLALAPRTAAGEVGYIVLAGSVAETWPVGWKPTRPARELAPAMFEFFNVNIVDVPAATAVAAIASRLKLPVLYDHNALAREGIDPAKENVKLPPAKTTYSLALSKLLFQARLKSELRVDEAGAAFFWITTLKQR